MIEIIVGLGLMSLTADPPRIVQSAPAPQPTVVYSPVEVDFDAAALNRTMVTAHDLKETLVDGVFEITQLQFRRSGSWKKESLNVDMRFRTLVGVDQKVDMKFSLVDSSEEGKVYFTSKPIRFQADEGKKEEKKTRFAAPKEDFEAWLSSEAPAVRVRIALTPDP